MLCEGKLSYKECFEALQGMKHNKMIDTVYWVCGGVACVVCVWVWGCLCGGVCVYIVLPLNRQWLPYYSLNAFFYIVSDLLHPSTVFSSRFVLVCSYVYGCVSSDWLEFGTNPKTTHPYFRKSYYSCRIWNSIAYSPENGLVNTESL